MLFLCVSTNKIDSKATTYLRGPGGTAPQLGNNQFSDRLGYFIVHGWTSAQYSTNFTAFYQFCLPHPKPQIIGWL